MEETNWNRSAIKEPARGILLYSDNSTFPDTVAPDESAAVHKEKSKSDADNTKNSHPPPVATENAPDLRTRASSDKKGAESSTTLHPDDAHNDTKDTSKGHHSAKQPSSKEKDSLSNEFHFFTWLNESQPITWPTPQMSNLKDDFEAGGLGSNRSFSVDEESLKADLKEIGRSLKHRTSFEDRLIYKECPQCTRREVYDLLQKDEKEVTALGDKDPSRRKIFEGKVELLNKAEALFQFFLPSRLESPPTAEKFWGALHRLLDVSVSSQCSMCAYHQDHPLFPWLLLHGGILTPKTVHVAEEVQWP